VPNSSLPDLVPPIRLRAAVRMGALALPREPERARPHGFPIVAVLAPVIGSLLIWALTRSPFALVFALLGPLVAIASVADARLQSRRTGRRESARFDSEVASTRMAIERRHAEERQQLLRAVPSATGLISRGTRAARPR
jgi:S-DNA-T family DNA segregation ATPase FtsK/SpoIIIE